MIDSVIIGYNHYEMNAYVEKVKSMGLHSGAYRDLNVNYIEHNGHAYHALDILTHFFHEGRPGMAKPFHVFDLLNPAIIYLGTYLTRRGFSFDYVNLFHLEKDKLRRLLTENEVLTVAITTTNYVSAEPIQEIIGFVRQYAERAKVIVGGPYINHQVETEDRTAVESHFEYLGADFYVINVQGETAFVKILDALKNNGDFDAIANIAYKKNGGYVLTPHSPEHNPLAENRVDFSLFPQRDIGNFVDLRTAISCPFSCAFCAYPLSAGKYQYLSVADIEKELAYLHDLGTVSTIFFVDDTFNVPNARFRDLLRMMIKRDFGFKWSSFFRCDHADEETIELMARAGCEGVFLGIESGSEWMLKRMKSNASVQKYLKGVQWLSAAGIATHANVIVGFPGESEATVQETLDFIEAARPTFFKAQLWYADPITPVWAQRQEYGIRGSAYNWSHDTMDVRTACDLIERMILTVENSIWSTQYGFVWGVFYLLRHGMAVDQVLAFAKSYGQVIKEKLLFPNRRGIHPQLIENLRRSSQFDRAHPPGPERLELYTGSAYAAAEKFWLAEFQPAPPPYHIDAEPVSRTAADPAWESLAVDCAGALCAELAARHGALAPVFLAAYSILLGRLNGRQDSLIVVAIQGSANAAPVRLYPRLEARCGDFIRATGRKLDQIAPHGLYGLHFLIQPLRLRQQGGTRPICDVGYRFGRSGAADLRGELALHPELQRELALVLEVDVERAEQPARLYYASARIDKTAAERLGGYLSAILEQAARAPERALEDLVVETGSQTRTSAPSHRAEENFRF